MEAYPCGLDLTGFGDGGGGGVAANFPTIAATSNGSSATTATADVNLPASIANGDLLLAFVAIGGGTISTPSGWQQLFTTISSVTNRLSVFYRVADGTEGSTLSVTSSTSQAKRYVIYRITGYNGNPFGGGANSGGSNGASDPPSLSAPSGSDKITWFSAGVQSSINALPTNYGSSLNGGTFVFLGHRELEAASEDPGAFGVSSNSIWSAGTVGVRGV